VPLAKDTLTLTGGEFTTIANQAESKYNYHGRNIEICRSNVDIGHFKHFVTGEIDHGAPYRGFLSIVKTAFVTAHDCLFTGHFIYTTIGSAGLPVKMGSYDINAGHSANVTFARCTQTTDIMDSRYWGLLGSNFCRDMVFEDCNMSRFDAHMGVTNCTLRRCTLGWQCLNAIGNGTFLIEEVDAYGRAFVNLRLQGSRRIKIEGQSDIGVFFLIPFPDLCQRLRQGGRRKYDKFRLRCRAHAQDSCEQRCQRGSQHLFHPFCLQSYVAVLSASSNHKKDSS
jgi:hypothetical protein